MTPRASMIPGSPVVGFLLALLALAALFWAAAPAIAAFLLYLPDRSDPGDAPTLAGVKGEDVSLAAADGTRLHGWWFRATAADSPPTPASSEPGSARSAGPGTAAREAPAILFLHGNAGHIGHRGFQAEGMLTEGVSVFLLSYRGYGRSEGRPSEEGMILDAAAAFDWVSDRAGGPGRVLVHGRSLGGAVAAAVVARNPGAAALVLESTFTDLEAMGRAAYPFLPGPLFRRLGGRMDTLARVREAGIPVLVVHGTADRLIPHSMGETLAAASADASFLSVAGAGHNDLPWVAGSDYFRRVAAFAHEVTRPGAHPRRRSHRRE